VIDLLFYCAKKKEKRKKLRRKLERKIKIYNTDKQRIGNTIKGLELYRYSVHIF